MAVYSSEVFQNEFLPDGGTDVNAIVSITVDDAGKAGSDGAAGEIIIIDCSGSMGMRTMAERGRLQLPRSTTSSTALTSPLSLAPTRHSLPIRSSNPAPEW